MRNHTPAYWPFIYVLVVMVVTTALAVVAIVPVHLFEDGSWAIGVYPYLLSGCWPGALCSGG